MLHPHDLKYKSILGRLAVSYVCTGIHAHPHTHTRFVLAFSFILAHSHRYTHLASNQPTCYNEIHCTVMLAEKKKCLHAWSVIIHLEYELVELHFVQQILMTNGDI